MHRSYSTLILENHRSYYFKTERNLIENFVLRELQYGHRDKNLNLDRTKSSLCLCYVWITFGLDSD